jgi:hypothetical protein
MIEMAGEPELSGSVKTDDGSSAAGFFNLTALRDGPAQPWEAITCQIALKSIDHDRKSHHELLVVASPDPLRTGTEQPNRRSI